MTLISRPTAAFAVVFAFVVPLTGCVWRLLPEAADPIADAVQAQQDAVQAQQEMVFWQSIVASTNRADFEAYLARWPAGVYASLARERLTEAAARLDPTTPAPGARFRDCDGCPELVVVPAGTFRMGSTRGQADETPVHEARLDAFALGRYEVTRGEFQAFVTATGHESAGCSLVHGDGRLDWERRASWRRPGFEQENDHPAVCVSWTDAQAYARWLSEETGARYGLPSEAEWEYGARANTAGERYWDGASGPQCAYANAGDRALGAGDWPLPVVNCTDGAARTAPVGSYGANGFGLHDVLGNVWEWTADCWHDDYRGAPADGSAWTRRGDCDRRVLRGGSWETVPAGLRSANRYQNGDNRAAAIVGFRVARVLESGSASLTAAPSPGAAERRPGAQQPQEGTPAGDDAALKDLQLSEGPEEGHVVLSPAFDPAVTFYTADVTQETVTLDLSAAPGATFEVTGAAADGTRLPVVRRISFGNISFGGRDLGASADITLSGLTAGANTMEVAVTAADETAKQGYTLVVTRTAAR